MAGSVVGQGRLRIYYRHMRLCPLSRSLVALDLEAVGTR